MKHLIIFCSLFLAISLSACAEKHQDLNLQVADELIVPAYQELGLAAGELLSATNGFCSAPANKTLEAARTSFTGFFLKWEFIQHIRFGPIEYLMRNFRLQMWPDKRGKVGKHLNQLLTEGGANALEPKNFVQGSVAVQGVGAYERLIYGYRFDAEPSMQLRQCEVLQAIANSFVEISSGLVYDWHVAVPPFRDYMAIEEEANDLFENGLEVSTQLLNSINTQLTLISTQKLALPVGLKRESANPKRAEAWRSGLSMKAIESNVEALFQLYSTGFAPRVGDDSLDHEIRQAFSSLLEKVRRADAASLINRVREEQARTELTYLQTHVEYLRSLISNRLSAAIGVPLAFNSLDGD